MLCSTTIKQQSDLIYKSKKIQIHLQFHLPTKYFSYSTQHIMHTIENNL